MIYLIFKEAADTPLTLEKCNISTCTILKVCHTHSSQVAIKTTCNNREHWKLFDILKRGNSMADIQQALLRLKVQSSLSVAKIKIC